MQYLLNISFEILNVWEREASLLVIRLVTSTRSIRTANNESNNNTVLTYNNVKADLDKESNLSVF